MMKKMLPIVAAFLVLIVSVVKFPVAFAAGATAITSSKVDELEGLKFDGVTWTSGQICTSSSCYSE